MLAGPFLLKNSLTEIETFILHPKNLEYANHNRKFLDKDIRNLSFVRADTLSPQVLVTSIFVKKWCSFIKLNISAQIVTHSITHIATLINVNTLFYTF